MTNLDVELKGLVQEHLDAMKGYVRTEVGRQIDEINAALARRKAAGVADGFGDEREEREAAVRFLRTGDRDLATKAMVIGSNPDGGYAVPSQLSDEIVEVGAEQGAIRKLARVHTPQTGDYAIIVSPTLAGAGRVGETDPRTNTTTPSLARIAPTHGAIYAVAPISNALLNDAKFDIVGHVTASIGTQFGVTESADFVTGDGVAKALGFLASPLAATPDSSRAFGTVEKLHAGSTTDFDVDDLLSLVGKLAPRYRRRAAFVFHPDTETYIRKLKSATSGEYYWQAATAAGTPNTLLGYPCFVDVNMPTIASGAAVVAVADWAKFYAIVDVGPTMLLRDPYTSKGQVLIYVEKRAGGCVVDSNAGKVLVMSV